MEIEVKVQFRPVVSFEVKGKVMQCRDFREDMFVEPIELTVKIFSAETGSKIACHYSIGVEHGNDVEDER